MAGEKELKQAKSVYDSICKMLDEEGWRYNGNAEELVINTGAVGEDLPIDLTIRVDPKKTLVSVWSKMPFNVPKGKLVEMAIAISMVNYGFVDGNFDYNFIDGSIYFRLTSSFKESLIGKETFKYMVMLSCAMVDKFNDKFLMIIKDKMTLDELEKFIKED